VNYHNSLVVTITVTRYLWAPSNGDHFIYMWRHLHICSCNMCIISSFVTNW